MDPASIHPGVVHDHPPPSSRTPPVEPVSLSNDARVGGRWGARRAWPDGWLLSNRPMIFTSVWVPANLTSRRYKILTPSCGVGAAASRCPLISSLASVAVLLLAYYYYVSYPCSSSTVTRLVNIQRSWSPSRTDYLPTFLTYLLTWHVAPATGHRPPATGAARGPEDVHAAGATPPPAPRVAGASVNTSPGRGKQAWAALRTGCVCGGTRTAQRCRVYEAKPLGKARKDGSK